MDVAGSPVRNSSTACRNHCAPNTAATSTPPRAFTHPRLSSTAFVSSTDRVQRGSVPRGGAIAPNRRCTSTSKLANVTRYPLTSAPGAVTMARCRCKLNRSRNRAPSPSTQSCTVSLQTPNRAATTPSASPSNHADTAPNTTSTPVTLPGSASQGSTRSRCPQPPQRAIAMRSTTKLHAACSFRQTRAPVSRGLAAPQRPQLQPARSCCTIELATTSSYLLE